MMKSIILLISLLFISGCVSTSSLEYVVDKNEELKKEVALLRQAEAGELVAEHEKIKSAFSYLVQKSKLGDSAMEHLLNEGWKVVTIKGTINIKQNEYDYTGTDYLIVSNVGVMNQTIAYEEGFRGSFFRTDTGEALAKEGFMSIQILDRSGDIQEFSEYKVIE